MHHTPAKVRALLEQTSVALKSILMLGGLQWLHKCVCLREEWHVGCFYFLKYCKCQNNWAECAHFHTVCAFVVWWAPFMINAFSSGRGDSFSLTTLSPIFMNSTVYVCLHTHSYSFAMLYACTQIDLGSVSAICAHFWLQQICVGPPS